MQNSGVKERINLKVYDTGLIIPTTVIRGENEGGQITVSAGVHSREYIGIDALTSLANELNPKDISGTVVILHCINYDGFICRSADVFPQDGMNLNREFPGNNDGSITQRVAAFLQENIIAKSDYLIDLHSGGFCEELVPHVYFHGTAKASVCELSEKLARLTSAPYIVKSSAVNGFYSYAGQMDVPAIILERGGMGVFSRSESDEDKADVLNILRGLGFLNDGKSAEYTDKHLIKTAFYEDSPCSGCWYPTKKAGDKIEKNEILGEIRSIYGELLEEVRAKESGVILYQTASLGIEKGTSMTAYGKLED